MVVSQIACETMIIKEISMSQTDFRNGVSYENSFDESISGKRLRASLMYITLPYSDGTSK